MLRQTGPWFLTWALYVRAIVAVRCGNADEAIALVRESLTCIRDLQDKYAFAYTLVPLVGAAVLKGDDMWAARILGAKDTVSERTGATVVLKLVHDLKYSGTGGSCAPWPGSVGRCVPCRASDLFRCAPEGHRPRLA